ncbi:MAG: family 16 glycosylhydrolase [Bacteroidales bacterium]|nr:family 16 glycosylhydrolase [Bacteroidales bacterium]
MKQILIFLLIIISNIVKSQTPDNDPHFVLDTYDNFNSLNSSLWNSVPNGTWGLETFNANNVTATGGVLTLKCEKINGNYISGGIETVNKKTFSYGYYEIYSQIPKGMGYWGGFWFHMGSSTCARHEIDVLEPNGCDCSIGTQFHCGLGNYNTSCYGGFLAETVTGLNDLTLDYNKYSLQWTPSLVKISVNDNLVKEFSDPKIVSDNPMYMFLTFQIDPNCTPNSSTVFPAFWKYKSFKYYKLKTDCSNGIVSSNFDFINHEYKVQKYYSLSSSTIPSNSSIILRATDYIELDEDFIVPYGSEFTAITHCLTCPQ